MATRAEQLKRLKQGEEAKKRVMDRINNPVPTTPTQTKPSRADILRQSNYVVPSSDKEYLLSKLPQGAVLPSAFTDYENAQKLKQANKQAQSKALETAAKDMYKNLAGFNGRENIISPTSPLTGYEKPSEYEFRRDEIANSDAPGIAKAYAQGMNWLTRGNPVGSFISRIGSGAAETFGYQPSDALQYDKTTTGSKVLDKTADISGMVASAFTPMGGAPGTGLVSGPLQATEQALLTRSGQLANSALTKGLSKVMKPSTAQGLSREIGLGVGTGVIGNPAMSLATGQDSGGELLESALIGGGLGGAIGAAGYGVSKGISSLLNRKGTPNTKVNNTTTSPDVDTIQRSNIAEGTTPENVLRSAPEPNNQPPLKQVTPEVQEADEIVNAVQQPRVRDRVYNFLDEQEQAARQRIAGRRNRISANPVDEWADYSIIMAAKLGKGTIKAVDFTEALVKEFGEDLRPYADDIFRKSKEILRKQERMASKEGLEAAKFNAGGGDADTFAKGIARDVKKKNKTWDQRWEKIRSQFTDDLAPLEGLEKRVRGYVASADDSLYKSARLFKGVPERANMIVRDRLTPLVNNIEKAGYTSDELGMYALAKHAQDVNNAGYKSGFTNAEIADVLKKYGTPEMEAAQQQLVQVNRDMLNELVESGVVSKDLADVLNERWKNYIPLFRELDDNKVEFGRGLSSSLANVTSPIKALKGSEKKVIDPLENMVKNIFQSVNSAERNKVARQLEKLAALDKDQAFIRKLDKKEQVGRKNVVNVKVNGKDIKYEVEPEVYKALLNLDKESSNMLVNVLSKPASILRAGATLTPEFSLRNPVRDVVQAFVTSKSGFNPLIDFPVGLIQSISKGDLYKSWIDNLGSYGNTLSMDRRVHREALEKVLKQPASKKFVNIINGKSFINLMRAISDTTESATKVGEYRAALRKGMSPKEAAYQSRDVMDFARAGSSVRQANKIVAFLNANIQGKSKLIRSIKENPVGTTTRAFVAVTLPTVGIYAFNQANASETQRQTIENAPDWMRDSFWLLAIPGTDTVARIPKPFDVAPLFANLPERALEYTKENDPEAFDGFIRRSMGDMALPVQITGLWPFIEGMANYSFFREGDIIPQREQGLEYKDQYDPVRTTETAKLLALGAEKLTGGQGMFKNFSSPRIMDNTIQGLTAGLGKYATDAIDALLKTTGIVDRPSAPTKKLEEKPFLRAFLVDPEQGGKAMDKFYDEKDKLSKEKASANLNEKDFTKSDQLKLLNDAAKLISDINKQIRQIERGEGTGDEKRALIEPLIKERNRLVQESMKQLKDLKK